MDVSQTGNITWMDLYIYMMNLAYELKCELPSFLDIN